MPLSYMPASQAFQDPDRPDAADPSSARAVVIPFGLEASVSYGGGTADGPAAILAASQQLELYDEEFGCETSGHFGIATLEPPKISENVAGALEQLEGIVETVVADGRFPLVLGGEHSVTAGAIRPLARRIKPLTVLQIDAHADLRDGYLGEHYSHASAMRRVLDHDGTEVIALGIRAISKDEVEYLAEAGDRVQIYWAKDQQTWDMPGLAHRLADRDIYVTFDLDGLDSAIMPATGTPMPGGLDFWQAMSIIRMAGSVGRIVGGDVVELAPIPNWHASDFTAALVANKLLNYALMPKRPSDPAE